MFTKTFKNDGPNYGDPAMSIIIPTPQYASDYTWSSVKDPTGAEFNNKVSIIIKKSEKSGLLLDGNAVTWMEQKVGYVGCPVQVIQGWLCLISCVSNTGLAVLAVLCKEYRAGCVARWLSCVRNTGLAVLAVLCK